MARPAGPRQVQEWPPFCKRLVPKVWAGTPGRSTSWRLEELNATPTTTLQYIVGQLNAIYGAGTYAYDTVADPTTGNTLTGNGPSGLIYNTKTVQDLGAVAIGTPSTDGAPRDPMRYDLAPVGYGSAADFYLYVSHAKSGTESSDATRRGIEASEVVAATPRFGCARAGISFTPATGT